MDIGFDLRESHRYVLVRKDDACLCAGEIENIGIPFIIILNNGLGILLGQMGYVQWAYETNGLRLLYFERRRFISRLIYIVMAF